ncbi:hypothetical protein Tco_0322696 [Tanacetum coccineum]
MSTRSTSSNLFSPLRDPESLIRRRNLGELSSLFNFEEVMSIPHNNMGPPPAGPLHPPNNGPSPVGAYGCILAGVKREAGNGMLQASSPIDGGVVPTVYRWTGRTNCPDSNSRNGFWTSSSHV